MINKKLAWQFGLGILMLALSTNPAAADQPLSELQRKRFQQVRAILEPLDKKDFSEALSELTDVTPVEGHLLLQEVIARTFQELAKEYKLDTAPGRQNLYGRIQMNMAFLQMGGLRLNQLPPRGLDRDIVIRLKKNLPEGIAADTRLFYTLED
ncbi:MAG: hypothetical protein K8I00_06625 [Candidatus Omnitrophica bacterium]|nr:hypothetical protein [Candidatus Omnitrophota bacterium]